ncbi:MAG: hypothetical protein PHS17_01620 [Desulfobacterales bacterium]|nr:hypothetical protein [Desulfobacterales bacterium]
MNKGSDRENAVCAWLATEEAQSLVKRAARWVLRQARLTGYSLTFMGFDPVSALDDDALLEDVESRLKFYILENRRGIQEKIVLLGPKAGGVLQNGFMQEWTDASRNRESDPWHYLYKRAVEIMGACPDFARKKVNNGMLYSLGDESASIPEPADEDLRCVVFPEAMAEREDLKRSETILGLAKYFWKAISAQWGEPVWVPVRSLINWIALRVDLSRPRRAESSTTDQQDPLDGVPDEDKGLPVDEEKVALWARKFAASLDEDEGLAFALHWGDGRTLSEVARRIGYKNPSGVSYLIDKAKEKMKRFVRDLPWLSPPDLNEEALSLFLNATFSDLKKNRPEP